MSKKRKPKKDEPTTPLDNFKAVAKMARARRAMPTDPGYYMKTIESPWWRRVGPTDYAFFLGLYPTDGEKFLHIEG